MNHRVEVLGAILLGLTGCMSAQTRLQSADEGEHAAEKEQAVKTLGEITSIANADPIVVSGVGLVVGLEGTGGDAPPGGFRTMLENQLRKQGYEHPKEILASPNTSMVLVSALIPAGALKGDPLDLDISLPPQSRTTSLRGGILKECQLIDFDTAKNLNPSYAGADKMLPGHPLASASGHLLVGIGDGDENAKLCHGRVWGGGKTKIDRPFYLVLNSDQQFARVAQVVAERVNETFHGPFRGALSDMAVAKNNQIITLSVPQQYRHNLPRYLRVVRLIPLRETSETRVTYRRKLAEELLDPAKTLSAALRLEALGSDSVATLKTGLQSQHLLVRFAAAEALAYLGSASCGDVLAHLVEEQLALRAFSLTALASLDDAICHIKLRDLLGSTRPETRYGAFRALRVLDEHDAAVQGELLNESFWLHCVAPTAPPLVHVSSNRRAEIVLFGEETYLTPPFSFMAGQEFTVTAGRDDDKCTISRFTLKKGAMRRQCSLKLEDVLHTLADLGGLYPDAVEMLRQADKCRCMTAALAVDALPQATSIFELAKAGADDPEFQKTDPEILNAKMDFGATPTLYEKDAPRRATASADKEEDDEDKPAKKDEKKSAPKKHTTW